MENSFDITFNMFGEYKTFDVWVKADFWSPAKKRKREDYSTQGRETKRHKYLNEKDIDKIEEDRHEANTKRRTVWALSVFTDWMKEKEMPNLNGSESAEILNKMLRSFYPSVQSSNRTGYSISSYTALRAGISRNFSAYDILKSTAFKSSNDV